MKKRSERRKHCALAVVRRSEKFRHAAVPHRRTDSAMAVVIGRAKIPPTRRRPRPGGAGPPKFNQLEIATTCTYRPSLVKFDARNFELSW